MKPDYVNAYANKASSLSDIGKHDEAIECYDKALSLRPEDSDIYFNKGVDLRKMKRYNEALKCFQTCLKLRSGDFECCLYLAECFAFLGKRKEALQNFKRARFFLKETKQQFPNKENSLKRNIIKLETQGIILKKHPLEEYF